MSHQGVGQWRTRVLRHITSTERNDLVCCKVSGTEHKERTAIDQVCHRNIDERNVAGISQRAGECNDTGFSGAGNALFGEKHCGKSDFSVHSLKATAEAVGVILVDRSIIKGRCADRAVGPDVLCTDHMADHIV